MQLSQALRPIFFELKIQLSSADRVYPAKVLIEASLPGGIEVSLGATSAHCFRNIHDDDGAIVQSSAVCLVLDEGEGDRQFIVECALDLKGDVRRIV